MGPYWYILDGKIPIPATVEQAEVLLGDFAARTVAKTRVEDYEVSTVFLVLDHGFMGDYPVLFETAIFNAERPTPSPTRRYASWDEWAADVAYWNLTPAQAACWLSRISAYHGRLSEVHRQRVEMYGRKMRRALTRLAAFFVIAVVFWIIAVVGIWVDR